MSRGVKLVANININDISENQIQDIIALPGGLGGAKEFASNKRLLDMTRNQLNSQRLLGAICAAPAVTLESNGLINNYNKLTC